MRILVLFLTLLLAMPGAFAQGFGSSGSGWRNGGGSGGGLTSPVGISDGGTGQTTKAAAFDALSPLTTQGDILYGGASGAGTRLGKGTALQILRMNSGATAPEWATPAWMTNPLTTTGDTIYSSDNSGTPARLARGTIGQRSEMGSSSIPKWADPPAAAPSTTTPKLKKYGETHWNGTTYKNYGWTGGTQAGGAGAITDDTDLTGGRIAATSGTTNNNYEGVGWSEGYKPIINPKFWFRTGMKSTTLANKSVYIGATTSFSAFTSADSSTSANYIAIRRQGATDTNYTLAYCNASTVTTVDTGVAAALNDDHTWCLEITATQYNVYCDGVFCCSSPGTDLPSSSTALIPCVLAVTRSNGNAADMNIYSAAIEYN